MSAIVITHVPHFLSITVPINNVRMEMMIALIIITEVQTVGQCALGNAVKIISTTLRLHKGSTSAWREIPKIRVSLLVNLLSSL